MKKEELLRTLSREKETQKSFKWFEKVHRTESIPGGEKAKGLSFTQHFEDPIWSFRTEKGKTASPDHKKASGVKRIKRLISA